jgi:hypothetical protein
VQLPAARKDLHARTSRAAPLLDPAGSADRAFRRRVACVRWPTVPGRAKKSSRAHHVLRAFCLIKSSRPPRQISWPAPKLLPSRRKHIHHLTNGLRRQRGVWLSGYHMGVLCSRRGIELPLSHQPHKSSPIQSGCRGSLS